MGIGLFVASMFSLMFFRLRLRFFNIPVPLFRLREIGLVGCACGSAWCIGQMLKTAAISNAGASSMGVACEALQLIGSGLWGICYHREIRGMQLWLWLVLASFTLTSSCLLVGEMTK